MTHELMNLKEYEKHIAGWKDAITAVSVCH